jgi:hypothetical protein
MYDDDMMGLAFGEGMLDADVIKDHVMAAAAGGAAAFAAGYGISKLPLPAGWDPLMRTRVKLSIGAVAGIGVARVIYDRNPEAAMAITGAVTGLSLLGLVMTWVKPEDAMTLPGLSDALEADDMDDADDEALLSMYDDDTGSMSDLATPGVTVAPPAFAGLADPTVTPEALFGLEGTIVQEETLGGYNAYMS